LRHAAMAYANIEDQRAASKRHYLANKGRYFERNTRYHKALREYVQNLKESTPCADCGNYCPYYVMDFDIT
jgi:hypothetical protein